MKTEYDLLFAACEIVTKHQKIQLVRPRLAAESSDLFAFLEEIAEATNIRLRKVALTERWWKNDCGPLLGFYQGRPCALIAKKLGGYQLIDNQRGRGIKVSVNIAKQISATAFQFYSVLPTKIRTLRDFFDFSLSWVKTDYWMFAGIQLLISLLILIVPIMVGILFNAVVPNADFLLLWQVAALLVINAWVIVLCSLSQTSSRLRLRFKLNAVMTPAIWDKILKLPLRFFRRFSAGDIAFRAGAVADVQNALMQLMLQLIAGGMTSILILILLFYYNWELALMAALLAGIVVLISIMINYRQLKFMRRLYYRFGQFIGFGFEIIAGITKIRVTNAMSRVFSLWVNRLGKRTEAELKMKFYSLGLEVFIALMTVISSLLFYGLAEWLGAKLSFGNFIAFYTAYSLLFITLLTIANDTSGIVRVWPLWKQSRIIFTAELEHDLGRLDPGELSGDIVMKDICFRYHAYEQPLFKNLSLSIYPGEFIAVVGPSGSGKSTLFRLMLGFEEPEAGEIYFNGLNLRSLKLVTVRRQIGVVVQNSTLIPGTILANIAGNSTHLTRVDAWEIADRVGLAGLIKQLPMQMDTLITEGAITLSGGEAQRLILARALAQKPKIIVLDEATSALDNTTQAVVHNYLKQLHATQIIAAHRLSTIVNADRILVMDKGSIVQTGTFSQLMSQPGLFAQMAKRQL